MVTPNRFCAAEQMRNSHNTFVVEVVAVLVPVLFLTMMQYFVTKVIQFEQVVFIQQYKVVSLLFH